ncbi:MAG: dihydroorotate dehydrogenase [Phycisphaerales bacterium]|nr:dihydroorotate dehydrogenase [Phycisphaerales bacterium]
MNASDALALDFCGLSMSCPVVLAAGTAGYGVELNDAFDLAKVGAVVTKSITRAPREGNSPPRIIDSRAGMLNAIGLANVGIDAFLSEQRSTRSAVQCRLFGSVAGHATQEYIDVASAMDGDPHIDAIELNVSCPNTSDGLQFGECPVALTALLREVRPVVTRKPLIVKLSPNATDIVNMAAAAIASGADALTVANTFTAMAIDVNTRAFRLSNKRGGYSGTAIHPIIVRMVHDIYANVARDARKPIIGLGGVSRWEDAAEFILAGATLVGMGTALFIDPRSPLAVVDGLARWTRAQGCSHIAELIGAVHA